MKIQVTLEDIKAGRPASPSHCPIAQAAKRACGMDPEEDGIAVGANCICRTGTKVYKDLPLEARSFIYRFDNRLSVEPFEFEINLP